MLFFILYKTGYLISNILPLKVAYLLAERLADIHYSIAKNDREAVARNLSAVLNEDIKENSLSVKKTFRNFALYLVDFFRIPRLTKESLKRRVRVTGLENLDGVLKSKKGAIVLTCHIGNWEMGAVVLAMMGYKISLIALNHKHKNINDFFIRQREIKGVGVITMGSIMKRCISTLLNKEILALAGDRDFTNSGITLDFFGVPTSIPKGPAMISLKTNSPIVPTFFVREDRYNYRFIFDKPIEPENIPGMKSDEAAERVVKKVASIMEKYIKRYPQQWMLFRNFWEAPTDAVVM